MFRRGRMIGFFGFLVLVLLLAAGGVGLYRSGFAQGVIAGAAADGGIEQVLPEGLVAPRYLPYGYHRGPSLLGMFFGLLFFGGLSLLFLGMVGRLFFFRRWASGPGKRRPHPGWYKAYGPHRGPRGSWVWQPDQSEEESEPDNDPETPEGDA